MVNWLHNLNMPFAGMAATDMAARPANPSTPHVEGQSPYLRLHHVTIFVRDQDRSLRFYLDQLGFNLLADYRFGEHDRFVLVAPPDGTALLALVAPRHDSEEYKLIGQSGQGPVVFVTEDVTAKFHAWRESGVRFHHPPQTAIWGGMYTIFEDMDGNSFALAGSDEMTREIETQRRVIAQKLESERQATQELEIAKQVQARLFPQKLPTLRTLDYAGICIQARPVGGDYYDFLDLGRGRVGLVLSDISGKGTAAALLMANLQAHVRSQSATYSGRPFTPFALEQPHRFLGTVNRLFTRIRPTTSMPLSSLPNTTTQRDD
jgi:catechol 2,3-dioxygenase-like lactoylglutathione lyase family enzyme